MNDLENIEEDQENPFKNKLSNFDISSPSNVGIENILYLNPSFGRVFGKETLEGFIIFANASEHQVYIRDLQIILKVD